MSRQTKRDSETDSEGNVTYSNERYYSLKAELYDELRAVFKKHTLEALQDIYPTDIDDFRARFNPDDVLKAWLIGQGYTLADVQALPPIVRDTFKLFMRIALFAIVFGHGKPPGMPEEDANFEEPIP